MIVAVMVYFFCIFWLAFVLWALQPSKRRNKSDDWSIEEYDEWYRKNELYDHCSLNNNDDFLWGYKRGGCYPYVVGPDLYDEPILRYENYGF